MTIPDLEKHGALNHAIGAVAAIVANVEQWAFIPITDDELHTAIAAACDGVLIGTAPADAKVRQILVTAMVGIIRTAREAKLAQADSTARLLRLDALIQRFHSRDY